MPNPTSRQPPAPLDRGRPHGDADREALRATMKALPVRDAIIVTRRDGAIVDVNDAAVRQYGWSRDELLRMRVADLRPEGETARVSLARVLEAADRDGVLEVVTHRRKDGSTFPAEVSARGATLGGERLLLGVVRDVRDATAEREAESRARRARRALVALTQANEAVARAADERELLERVCQVLVDAAGYRLCWVGAVEHDAGRSIRPVARAGHDDGFVDALRLTWAVAERGHGPGGLAVRTGKPQFARDFDEEVLLPWRAEATARGYAAVTALPLEVGGAVVAVLSVYASEREAFDGEELEFLVRLAGDVSHGLAALRERVERARAEEALRVSREELRALAGRLDAIREEEKARIARDLHDELGQLLTGLRVDLDSIEERLAELPPGPVVRDLVERAVDASDLASRAIRALREVLSVLRPAALDHLGLAAALRQECRRFEERTRVPCRAELPDTLALAAEVETALFRIAQEALTNVARHAAAREVEVSLALDAGEARLTVRDDGAGLSRAAAPGRGLGIVGMSERAARLGGKLGVASEPGGGTVVTARIPLARGEGAEP